METAETKEKLVEKSTTAETERFADKSTKENVAEVDEVMEKNATTASAPAPTQGESVPTPHVDKTAGKDEDAAPPPAKKLRSSTERELEDLNSHSSSCGQALRVFKHIPIFIVDYHNDVLEFIYRCLATRHLPLEKNLLVHFDSHPDMVISRELPASASYDKETMLAELSIENWIMPACYAGHFDRVIWLKNSWCQQIPVGKYDFKIGHNATERIAVDCPLDYFISEGNYSDTPDILAARDMQLQVHNVDAKEPIDPSGFLSAADAPNFILDIDLDFFSTSNPFLEIYKDAQCYEQLTAIFHFESAATQADCGGTTQRRKLQLEALKAIFEHLEEHRTFDELPLQDEAVIAAATFAKIAALAASLKKHYADDEIDWLLIYDSGSTTDTNGLPHHISTQEQLTQYFAAFKAFLKRLPCPPVAITMACSAEDDYCPKTQVDYIRDQVLAALRDVFGAALASKPILHYLDEEWDVMQL